MAKNPFYADKIVLANGGVIETAGGTAIVAVSDAGSATLTGTETVIASEVALAEGSVLVGNSSGVAMALSAKGNAKLLLGNGTTITSASMSGDATITNAGVVTVTGATGTFLAGGKITLYKIGSAAESASGLLMGVGTSIAPAASSTAGAIFAEFRTKSTATSGDSRGLYWRHEINGAGGGGDAMRMFAKVTAAATTVRGSHISLDLDAAGTVSGFGAAVDAQVMLGAAAYSNTLACANMEIYGNTGATITGTTSLIRAVIGGNATAKADIESKAFLLDLRGVTAGTAGFIDTDITALTGYGSMKVKCPDGVTRYIAITTGS